LNTIVDLSRVSIQTNSELWEKFKDDGETILRVTLNKEIDHVGGKVALFNEVKRNYSMSAEMIFLGHHLQEGQGGWFGFVIRAQDEFNYELVWFMPNAEKGKTVAYISVAHGVVPWWSEAYACQQKGGPQISFEEWFKARVDVIDDELSIYVDEEHIFTKKLTYYLDEGQPGFYVGTATDAAFRRVVFKEIN
jgi:hypothetical protein